MLFIFFENIINLKSLNKYCLSWIKSVWVRIRERISNRHYKLLN